MFQFEVVPVVAGEGQGSDLGGGGLHHTAMTTPRDQQPAHPQPITNAMIKRGWWGRTDWVKYLDNDAYGIELPVPGAANSGRNSVD